jgi:cation diffusion facilitator family transporter
VEKNERSIYSALIADLLIAVTKFIAGSFTNSSSMIAEGIHSVVDTVNQILLLYGLKKSRKRPDQYRPFGYGKELYFWAFVVSILIFGLGGGVSIYQGILHIIHPEKLGDPFWNYMVLGLSFIFEGLSFMVAVKEFNKLRGELSWWKAIIKSKDPSSFLVLFEDGAALMGLLIVFVLMLLNYTYQLPYLDGVASVLVGALLVFISSILARESRSLLMGEGISGDTRQKIRQLAEKDEAVIKVSSVLSTYQSPEEVMLMLLVVFKEHLDTEDITTAIERIRANIKTEFPLVEFVLIQPHAVKK